MKISGPTTEYTAALVDGGDPLNGLIKLLSAFDPKFSGKQFSYTPQDKAIVMGRLPLSSALAIEPVATPRGFVIDGYPWSLKVEPLALATSIPDDIAAWFPQSKEFDEEGVETRRTFEEALQAMSSYNVQTDGVTYLVANLGVKFSLTQANQLAAVTGISVITLQEFKDQVAIWNPE